jgi:hypothetical protein
VTYLLTPNTNSYRRRKTLAAERKSLDERLRVGDEGIQNIYTAVKQNFREVRGHLTPLDPPPSAPDYHIKSMCIKSCNSVYLNLFIYMDS